MRHPALRNSARICGNKNTRSKGWSCSGCGPAIPGASVNIIEPHKIKVIWRGEEERTAGAGDARHFTQRCRGIRQMFDGFAGDDDVEGAGGVRQILRVGLRQVAGERRAEIPRRRSFRARFVARCWRSPRRTSGRHAQPGGGKSLRDRKPFPERAGPRRKANIRSPACTTGCVRRGLPARRRKLSGANRCTQPRGSSVRAKLLR